MDFPQPVRPTMATYCPGRILSERSSRISGIFSLYRKETLFSSMPPDRRSITCLPSETSGTASKNGWTIVRMGLICAALSAIPASDRNAPETMP